MAWFLDCKLFLQYLLVVVAANCKNSSESDNYWLMIEIVSVTNVLFVTVRCTRLMRLVRSDMWEKLMMRLVRLIVMRFVGLERLMSDDELDEDCEVYKSDH